MNAWDRNAGKFDRPSSSPPIAAGFEAKPAPVARKGKTKSAIATDPPEAYHGIEPIGRRK